MKYSRCKGIDKDWSAITFGCWQMAPSGGWGDCCSPKDAEAVVKVALDNGITAFDTAEGYGDGESERRLGKALGDRKDDVIVISKIWPDAELSLKAYEERLDGSLRALDRDYVDMYLIHWPGEYFNTADASARLCDYMVALKSSGKARLVGLSNFQLEDLKRLGEGVEHFSVNQVPYNLLERQYEGEVRSLCKEVGIPYMAFSPTAKGFLARRLVTEELRPAARRKESAYLSGGLSSAVEGVIETVEGIARERNCLPIQVVLAWVLAQENILTAIVGSRKPQQVPEFAAASDITLAPEQLTRLQNVSDAFLEARNQE